MNNFMPASKTALRALWRAKNPPAVKRAAGNARARAQFRETPCSCAADRSYRPLAGQRGWPARHLARRPAILAGESAHLRVATAELEIREMLRAAWLRPPLKPSFAERLWAVSSRLIRKDDRSYCTLAGPAVPDRCSCRPRPCGCGTTRAI